MTKTVFRKCSLIFLLFTIPFLLGLGIDLYVPSMPDMAINFRVSEDLVQLTISLYMLGYAVGQLFLGVLSDAYGRKKILVISALVFALGSFLAVFSVSIYFLWFCRLLQGLGAAGLGVALRAVASDCFSGLSLKRAMTFISTCWATGPIIGPFIGGYIEHYFNWKVNFYIYGYYSLIIFLFMVFAFKESHTRKILIKPKKIYKNVKIILSHKAFIYGTLILSLLYSVLVIFNVVGPFLIQVTMHHTPIEYGHIAFALGFANFIGNFFNQFLITYFDYMSITKTCLVTALFMSVVLVIFSWIFPLHLYFFIIPIFIMFVFMGAVFPNLLSKVMSLFPKIAGTLSAIFGFTVIICVFAMTSFATLLKTSTQFPLAVIYLLMLMIGVILFFAIKRFDKCKTKI